MNAGFLVFSFSNNNKYKKSKITKSDFYSFFKKAGLGGQKPM